MEYQIRLYIYIHTHTHTLTLHKQSIIFFDEVRYYYYLTIFRVIIGRKQYKWVYEVFQIIINHAVLKKKIFYVLGNLNSYLVLSDHPI